MIFGNPPYSVGQGNANDNNQNVAYPHLDERIRTTYADKSSATLKNSLYDSYIRAIRWASDRVGTSGIVGFVTNAGFIDGNTADGLRKCLADEFSSIYVFHLRGNQRTQGEQSRKEGGKIFGSGSRAPIAISFLVKNPQAEDNGRIFFHDIGDYLTREQKLARITEFQSIAGMAKADAWTPVTPDAHGDWLKQRDDNFQKFIALGDKDGQEGPVLFENYSNGVKTNRDAWVYGASKGRLETRVEKMIAFYNSEVERYQKTPQARNADVESFLTFESTQISWTREIKQDLTRGKRGTFAKTKVFEGIYRPFSKNWMYFDRQFNNCVYQMPQIFPEADATNLIIGLSAPSDRVMQFSVMMTNRVPSLHAADMVGAQYFPLYLYDEPDAAPTLFGESAATTRKSRKRDAISDAGLSAIRSAYSGADISKEDVFFYVYGLLHSPEYRERYADNFRKELPRIPCVKSAADFWAFSKAGRELGTLHVDYEKVAPHPVKLERSKSDLPAKQLYRVEKMRYGKKKVDGKNVDDRSLLIYNNFITLRDIPLEAYEYVVNGKPALDWVVERQCVKTDKDSGIVNDANDWANETVGDPKYPLELFQRVITVSLETMKIVKSLPKLDLP